MPHRLLSLSNDPLGQTQVVMAVEFDTAEQLTRFQAGHPSRDNIGVSQVSPTMVYVRLGRPADRTRTASDFLACVVKGSMYVGGSNFTDVDLLTLTDLAQVTGNYCSAGVQRDNARHTWFGLSQPAVAEAATDVSRYMNLAWEIADDKNLIPSPNDTKSAVLADASQVAFPGMSRAERLTMPWTPDMYRAVMCRMAVEKIRSPKARRSLSCIMEGLKEAELVNSKPACALPQICVGRPPLAPPAPCQPPRGPLALQPALVGIGRKAPAAENSASR